MLSTLYQFPFLIKRYPLRIYHHLSCRLKEHVEVKLLNQNVGEGPLSKCDEGLAWEFESQDTHQE